MKQKREKTPEEKRALGARLAAGRAKAAAERAAAPKPSPTLETGDADERRRRLTMGMDPEVAALLSDEQLAQIEVEENAAALDARRERALKEVRNLAKQRARVENNLIPADVIRSASEHARLNEKVKMRITVPNERDAIGGIKVDGVVWQHGIEREVPRHVAESMAEMMYRAHFYDVRFRDMRQLQSNIGMSGTVLLLDQNPPRIFV